MKANTLASDLHWAVSEGCIETTEKILKEGALVNYSISGEQLINHARTLPMLQLLHQHGADLNHVDGTGDWPLNSACEDNDLETIQWLISAGADINQNSIGKTALHTAARHSSPEIIKLLIQSGIDLNSQDADMSSALFYCSSIEIAQLLIDAGIDQTLFDCAGETAAQASYVDDQVRVFLSTQS